MEAELSFWQCLFFSLVCAFLGWLTNWIAVKLLFFPAKPWQIAPGIRWQAIIAKNAVKMALISVDRTVERFGNFKEVYLQLQPRIIVDQILVQMLPRMEEYIDDIMYEQHGVLWDNLPVRLRKQVYRAARRKLPEQVEQVLQDIENELPQLLDFRELVIRELEARPEVMLKIFRESGEKEFQFIINSGWVLGLLLGALFSLVIAPNPYWWLLVGSGFVLGWVTNWIAITLIFRPVKPFRILGFKMQGLLMRRRAQVSEVWSRIIAEELFTIENVAKYMLQGRNGDRTRALIRRNIRPILERSSVFNVATRLALGVGGYADIKNALDEKAIEVSLEPFDDENFNKDRAPIIAAELEARLEKLPPEEFQDMLRPPFKAHEIELIALGGSIGAVLAFLHWLLFL